MTTTYTTPAEVHITTPIARDVKKKLLAKAICHFLRMLSGEIRSLADALETYFAD